jgi:iron complex transport system permease protein
MKAAWPQAMQTVVMQVRLPRVLAALMIGAGLSVSGAAFQGVFRNPLVSPFILGVASGAGFGAALAILLANSTWLVQASAVGFGVLAVALAYGLSRFYRAGHTLVLVLCGVIVGTFFSSLIALVKYLADPYDKLPVIVYWLMGSLATVSQSDLFQAAVPMLLGMAALWMVRWKLNLLALGDEEASSLGVEVGPLKLWVVASATLITACAVSISGIIGWVGLVIPHLARMIYGPDYRRLIPASLSLGGCYLLLVDDLARNLSGGEIPLGILTATIGAPVFALALKKSSLGWAG